MRLTCLMRVCQLLAAACLAHQALAGTTRAPADFSGSWEMNYARSETVRDKIETLAKALERAAERRSRDPNWRAQAPGVLFGGNNGYDSLAPLIPLARFLELITTSTIVEIAQTNKGISISRNDDFTLECDFAQRSIDLDKHPFGSEMCVWDGKDLILQIGLPHDMSITYRLTVAANRSELRIVTTVIPSGRSKSFSLDKFFYRFEQPPDDYSCRFTLMHGNVCSRKAP